MSEDAVADAALVEAPPRADDFLAPVLFGLVARVRAAAARVAEQASAPGSDPEAIHDLRVALRRLRTALRPARCLFGRRHLAEIASGLRALASATGALRDEEVLRETLASLELPARARADVDGWLVLRAKAERRRRRMVAGSLAHATQPGSIGDVLAALERRLGHRRERPRSARALAAQVASAAAADIAVRLDAEPSDATAMHDLRIAYKRLRYSAELFAPILGDAAKLVAKEAARMQKQLGELHDLDEALRRLRRARSLTEATRTTVLRALVRARARKGREVGQALAAERALLSAATATVIA